MPNVPRTTVYTIVSLSMLACLGLILLYDLIQMAVVQHPDATTQYFTVALLVSVNNNCLFVLYVHKIITHACEQLRLNPMTVNRQFSARVQPLQEMTEPDLSKILLFGKHGNCAPVQTSDDRKLHYYTERI